jgi:hypothetical protein
MALLEQNIALRPYPAESYVFSRFAGVAYVKTFTMLEFFVSCSFPLDMNETRNIPAWHKTRYENISQNGWKKWYLFRSAFIDTVHHHRFCLLVDRRHRNNWRICVIQYWKLKSSLQQMALTQLVQEQWQNPFTCSSLTDSASDDDAL